MFMIFKDINCGYRTIGKSGLYVSSFQDVTKNQRQNGITESALYNYSSCTGTVKQINETTLNNCARTNGNCMPVLHLLPSAYSQESYDRSELIRVIDQFHPLFRIRPNFDASPFLDWMYQDIFAVLEESGTPLLVSLQELDLKEAAETLYKHSDLKLVLTNTTQWLNRQYIQFAKQFDNVYLETSNIIEYYGIENITNILGSERILFGTNMPEKEPYDKIFQLLYCELSNEQKENIAFRNYDRLMRRDL